MDVCKTERSTCKRKFTRSANQVEKLLQDGTDMSFVRSKLDELEKCWTDVQNKHDAYLSEIPEDEEALLEEEDTWLDDLQSRIEQIQISFLSASTEQQRSKQLQSVKAA